MASIFNIVQSYKLTPINFTQVSKVYAVLVRKEFRALFIRFGKVSLQVFENGTANITGLLSPEEGLFYIAQFCLKVGASILSYKIVSITATTRININFERLKTHPEAEYEPELYHAIYFTNEKGKAVVYHTGKVTLVGIKSISDVNLLFNSIKSKVQV